MSVETLRPAPTSAPPSGPPPLTSRTTLLRLAAAVLARRRFVLGLTLIGAALTAGWSLVVTPQYRARARFAPEERPATPIPSALASLASQLGASTTGGARSLQFYADVLVGPDLLKVVLQDSFPDPHDRGMAKPLLEILKIRGNTPQRRLANAVEYLQTSAVATSVNDRTGTISLSVTLPHPVVAAAVANKLYAQLEQFNYTLRRSAASEQRRFAQRELDSARAALTGAENALGEFLETNRAGLNSPRLAFQRDRFQRRIDLLQEVYITLARELEQAKVAEVRDTPLFTLIEAAEPPLDRFFPKRTRLTLLGALLGAAAAVAWIALRATGWTAEALDPEGYASLRAALRGWWP